MSATTPYSPQLEIEARFRSTRQRTLVLCEPLSAEDMMVQSSPETSPAKWHLAHTAWFFESFILREFLHRLRGSSKRSFRGSSIAITRALPPFRRSGCGLHFSRPGLERCCATGSTWTWALSGCWAAIQSRRR